MLLIRSDEPSRRACCMSLKAAAPAGQVPNLRKLAQTVQSLHCTSCQTPAGESCRLCLSRTQACSCPRCELAASMLPLATTFLTSMSVVLGP